MQSDAATVAQYLAELPADRRAALEAVRQTILAHLPEGYEEAINWGMITYQVPSHATPTPTTGSHWRTRGSSRRRTIWRSI